VDFFRFPLCSSEILCPLEVLSLEKARSQDVVGLPLGVAQARENLQGLVDRLSGVLDTAVQQVGPGESA
jgi:hypothetical protein